jgi:hypothetical protein
MRQAGLPIAAGSGADRGHKSDEQSQLSLLIYGESGKRDVIFITGRNGHVTLTIYRANWFIGGT